MLKIRRLIQIRRAVERTTVGIRSVYEHGVAEVVPLCSGGQRLRPWVKAASLCNTEACMMFGKLPLIMRLYASHEFHRNHAVGDRMARRGGMRNNLSFTPRLRYGRV